MFNKEELIQGIGAPLAETTSLPVCINDNALKFVYANQSLLDLFEYSEEELLGKSLRIIVGKNKLKSIFFEIFNLIRTRHLSKKEWVGKAKSGKDVHVTIEASRVRIAGKMYTLAVVVDNSKEAKLESTLQKTEDLNRLAEKISKRGNFEYNLSTKRLRWTEGLFDIFELPYSELGPSWDEQGLFFEGNEWDVVMGQLTEAMHSRQICSFETEMKLPDGRVKNLHVLGKIWEQSDFFHGTVRDITEEKAKETEVRKNEQSFSQLTESMPHIVCIMNNELAPTYMNRVGLEYLGITPDDFTNWTWARFHPADEYDRLKDQWGNAGNLTFPLTSNVQLKNADGSFRWHRTVLFPNYDFKQNIESWTFIGTDIHEQIYAQKELEKSNLRLRSLIDASPVAIYSITLDGIVKDFWNPAAERILGWSKEEVMGKFLPHVNESNIHEFKETAHETLEMGQTNRILKRHKKSGEEVMLEVTGGAIYDELGNVDEVLVTLIDVTEVINQRAQLQESVKEKSTLLQEIHHRVKNNLAIIVSMLQLQVFQSGNEEEKNKLMDAQNRIKSIAMVHELLYSTDEFNKINLAAYYENLLESIKNNLAGGEVHFKVSHKLDIKLESLNINQAIPLGLLINELVTNTLKYAFPCKKEDAFINLKIHRREESIYVEYEDNGVGFDITHDTFKSGLGLQIIDSLLSQLEADYEIETKQGFKLRFNFPFGQSGLS